MLLGRLVILRRKRVAINVPIRIRLGDRQELRIASVWSFEFPTSDSTIAVLPTIQNMYKYVHDKKTVVYPGSAVLDFNLPVPITFDRSERFFSEF